MATNNFLNMVGILLASGALWLCQRRARHGARSHRSSSSACFTLLSSVYVLGVRAGVPRPLLPLAADAHDLPHPDRRAASTCRRAARRCSSATTCRTSTARWSASCVQRFIRFLVYRPYYEHWALHWLLTHDARDPDRGRQRARRWRRSSGARQELAGRPRRLHLRRGRDQPHRQPAAVQARLRADRRGPRRAGRCRSTSIASGAASSASRAARSSGSGRCACRIR